METKHIVLGLGLLVLAGAGIFIAIPPKIGYHSFDIARIKGYVGNKSFEYKNPTTEITPMGIVIPKIKLIYSADISNKQIILKRFGKAIKIKNIDFINLKLTDLKGLK